jgi:hypothetical protein
LGGEPGEFGVSEDADALFNSRPVSIVAPATAAAPTPTRTAKFWLLV